MIFNFVCCLLYIYIVWVLGIYTLEKMRLNNNQHWLAFAVGFSELMLISTFLYFTCKLPIGVIQVIWLAGGISVTIYLFKEKKIVLKKFFPMILLYGLFLILLLPGIIRGDQYYVYRGNCYDAQTYLEQAVAISAHNLSYYENNSAEEIELESDVLKRGYDWSVNDRPSAGLMIAMLCVDGKGEIYWIVYLYKMFVLAMTAVSLVYLFYVLTDNKDGKYYKLIFIMISALYCMGFWGQIQFDIDAVSQLSSAGVFIALTAIFINYISDIFLRDTQVKKEYVFLLSICAAAGLVLYLENALMHGVMYLIAGSMLLILKKKHISFRKVLITFTVPITAFLVMVITNYRVVVFLFQQLITSMSGTRQEWAEYFNAYWSGKHGFAEEGILNIISHISNLVVSVCGLYNITPDWSKGSGIVGWIWAGGVSLIAIGVIYNYLFVIKEKSDKITILWCILTIGMIGMIGMAILGKAWSAGKLLYYISPYLYTIFCLPLLQWNREKIMGKGNKIVLIVSCIVILSNIEMVWERVYDTKVNWACTGYRNNYPSDMIAGLKVMVYFDFDVKQLGDAEGVVIEDLSMLSDNQFYLQYLKAKLTYAGIPWKAVNDVNYYGNEMAVSDQRILSSGKGVSLSMVDDGNGRFKTSINDIG